MKKLPPQDQRFLDAAEGWLGLGDHLSANEELDQITPELRANPKVLLLRLEIYWAAEKWEACVAIAGAVVKLSPNIPDGWVGRSFALHELKRTEEAYDLLFPAKDKFPKDWSIPARNHFFNLEFHQSEYAAVQLDFYGICPRKPLRTISIQ